MQKLISRDGSRPRAAFGNVGQRGLCLSVSVASRLHPGSRSQLRLLLQLHEIKYLETSANPRLAASADVQLCNYPPGYLPRYGFLPL